MEDGRRNGGESGRRGMREKLRARGGRNEIWRVGNEER